jgi:hypothetical protein
MIGDIGMVKMMGGLGRLMERLRKGRFFAWWGG